jgi:hypothetical protein
MEEDKMQKTLSESLKERTPVFREIGSLIRTNWPKYVVEILVIIIGITLSFFIDNYKEEAGRRVLEKTYLKNLLTDINEDIKKLDHAIVLSQQVIVSARYMLKLSSEEKKDVTSEEFAANFGGMLQNPIFISSNETFNDLKSGNSHIIVDTEIRSSLFHYYSFYDLIKITENDEAEGRRDILQPFLYRNFYTKGYDSEELYRRTVIPVEGDWRIVNDKMFINVAATRIITREGLIKQYQEALVFAKKVKNNLEKNLN